MIKRQSWFSLLDELIKVLPEEPAAFVQIGRSPPVLGADLHPFGRTVKYLARPQEFPDIPFAKARWLRES